MIDAETYIEVLVGCLTLLAQDSEEASTSHFEPDGPQAKAQGWRGREFLNWIQRERASHPVTRDFSQSKIKMAEITSAIEYVELKVGRTGFPAMEGVFQRLSQAPYETQLNYLVAARTLLEQKLLPRRTTVGPVFDVCGIELGMNIAQMRKQLKKGPALRHVATREGRVCQIEGASLSKNGVELARVGMNRKDIRARLGVPAMQNDRSDVFAILDIELAILYDRELGIVTSVVLGYSGP